jgi:putative ABC transport system ATP-binding protein
LMRAAVSSATPHKSRRTRTLRAGDPEVNGAPEVNEEARSADAVGVAELEVAATPAPAMPSVLGPAGSLAASVNAPETFAVAAVDGNDSGGGSAEPAPPRALFVESERPSTDEFRDLLGQAVGIHLDHVSREFGGRNEMHVAAVQDVSLDIGPGEFVAMMGPSGCGKTTLLALLGGLDRPTKGRVFAAGLVLGEMPEGGLADYRLQRVSTIFQTFNLIPSMSVEDNVALPLTLAGVPLEERLARARHLLTLVGLESRARMRASRLSGGEQQKVAVARALANRPGLILADEPTGSLDSAAGARCAPL